MVNETLRSAGEFGLIARLAQVLGGTSKAELLVGIGDDAAAWKQSEACLVATTDMLIEGIHFDLSYTPWRALGWKSLAVNLSDIAAMGAQPEWAFISIGLKPDTAVADVADLYAGMRDLADRSGCHIVGGDTVSVRSDMVVNVVVLGSVPAVEAETILRRDRGRVGDVVGVTGTLGAAAAGLHVLQTSPPNPSPVFTQAHLHPEPRLQAGQLLRKAGVQCAMDLSDGLIADLGKLCERSGCGAEIQADRLPAHPSLTAQFPDHAMEWAAGGGEDYELLFTAPSEVFARAERALRTASVPVTAVGRLTDEGGVRLVDMTGKPVDLTRRGWDHFGVH